MRRMALLCGAVLLVGGCGELARQNQEKDAIVDRWEGVHTVEVLKQAPAVEAGRVVFVRRACVTCHSVDGSRHTGPSLLGVYGSTVELRDGTTVTADEDYLRRSILKPEAEIVAGYRPEMTAYPNLRYGELDALVAYIKSLEEPASGTTE